MNFPYPTPRTVALVGLVDSSFGRSCERHDICGQAVGFNDVAILKKTIVRIGSAEEGNLVIREAIKAVKVEDGTETCLVGFLDRRLLRAKDIYVNKFVQVTKDLRASSKQFEFQRSARKRGLVEAILLDCIQEQFSQDV